MSQIVIDSPVGQLQIDFSGDRVCHLAYAENLQLTAIEEPWEIQANEAITGYFSNPEAGFNLPLAMSGTAFQQKVWQALREIPCGSVMTYGALAGQLKSSARAVGNACRRNPVPLVVPCHRVVAATGLGGFAGATGGRLLDIKRRLLNHENALTSAAPQESFEFAS